MTKRKMAKRLQGPHVHLPATIHAGGRSGAGWSDVHRRCGALDATDHRSPVLGASFRESTPVRLAHETFEHLLWILIPTIYAAGIVPAGRTQLPSPRECEQVRSIRRVNALLGLSVPALVTPLELLGECMNKTDQKSDPAIDEVRAARRRISQRFDHDPARLVSYYMKLQEKYQDRLLPGSGSPAPGAKSAA